MCDKQKFKEILTKFLELNNISDKDFDKVLSKYERDFRAKDLGRNVDVNYHTILTCIYTMEEINENSLLITEMVKLLCPAIEEEIVDLKELHFDFGNKYLGKYYILIDHKDGK